MKNYVSALLLAAMLLGCVSCGSSAGEETDTPQTSGTDTTAPADTEPSRENTPDSLPESMDFNTEIHVLFPMSDGGESDQIDWESKGGGDVVSDAVYNRQISVEERLGVTFDIISNHRVTEWADALRQSVLASDQSYDLIYGNQWGMAALVPDGIVMDLADAPHIDFDQPWWNNRYMEELSVGGARYLLGGDVSLSMLSYMSCMYFHKDQFEKISGESADDLYQLVLDGGWTMDRLAGYARLSYRDLNGNTNFDDTDQYGLGVVTTSTTDHLTFDSGVSFTTRDEDGMPVLTLGDEASIRLTQKLYSLFYENEGVHIYEANQQTLRQTLPSKLMNGEVTFMCGYFYSAGLLRDMTADYGLIPYPKLDENVEDYRSLVHDSAQTVAVAAGCGKLEAVAAAIEATAAENYRTVFPAYYEVALKNKYIRDDISGQIVDLIHDAGTTDFAYAYNYTLNNVGLIMRTMMSTKSQDLVSYYKAVESAAKSNLERLMDAFED